MSDTSLRELERRARGGDPQAESEWLVARTRRGDHVRLELLAWFGHPPAFGALALLPERKERARDEAWQAWDALVEAPELAEFLARLGARPAGRAAVVLGYRALTYLEDPEAWASVLDQASDRLRRGEPVEPLDPAQVPSSEGYYAERGRRVCELAIQACVEPEASEACLLEAINALQPDARLASQIRAGLRERFPEFEQPEAAACAGVAEPRLTLNPPLTLSVRLRGLPQFGALACTTISVALDLTLEEHVGSFLDTASEADRAAWRRLAVAWLFEPDASHARELIAACNQVGLRGLAARVTAAAGGDRAAVATWGLVDQLRDARRRLTAEGVAEPTTLLQAELLRRLVDVERGDQDWGAEDDDYVWRLGGPLVVVHAAEAVTYRPIALALQIRDEVSGQRLRGYLLQADTLQEDFRLLLRAHQRASHPALVALDGGVTDEGPHPGRLYLTAPLATEESFLDWARGDAGLDQRLRTVRTLAEGLAAFQDAGGTPGLRIDYGRLRVDTDGAPRLDLHGVDELAPETNHAVLSPPNLIQSLATMAPEGVEGRTRTPSLDVYALGSLLYHLLAHRWPFELETPRDLAQILNDEPPPLNGLVPDLPDALVAIVHQALARAPEDRQPNAAEVAKALARLLL